MIQKLTERLMPDRTGGKCRVSAAVANRSRLTSRVSHQSSYGLSRYPAARRATVTVTRCPRIAVQPVRSHFSSATVRRLRRQAHCALKVRGPAPAAAAVLR
eukprot:151172-Hanusia_phi.AAC.1